MFKENSIDNWILGGTVFLLIFTLGCYLWFQNEMAYLQPQDTVPNVKVQHLKEPPENRQEETQPIESMDVGQPDPTEQKSSDSEDTVQGGSENNSQQLSKVSSIMPV